MKTQPARLALKSTRAGLTLKKRLKRSHPKNSTTAKKANLGELSSEPRNSYFTLVDYAQPLTDVIKSLTWVHDFYLDSTPDEIQRVDLAFLPWDVDGPVMLRFLFESLLPHVQSLKGEVDTTVARKSFSVYWDPLARVFVVLPKWFLLTIEPLFLRVAYVTRSGIEYKEGECFSPAVLRTQLKPTYPITIFLSIMVPKTRALWVLPEAFNRLNDSLVSISTNNI